MPLGGSPRNMKIDFAESRLAGLNAELYFHIKLPTL